MGGGGAITVGVNMLPPVGLMLFSVGVGVGDGDGDVVVVGVVVPDGASLPPLPHAVASELRAINSAAPPTTTGRRIKRVAVIRGY